MCNRIGTIVKQQHGKVKAMKVTCRSWNCDECRPRRKRQLIAEVKEGEPQRLITLTVNPNWFNSPDERASELVKAWRTIRRRFIKMRGKNACEFMAIFEKTKLGEPHLHIVQRGVFISQKWLSAQLQELIGAKIVDIRYVRSSKKVAEYVSKYVGKEPFQFGTLKRYWRSLKYLAESKAAKRKRMNAGAVFYLLDCHWKYYKRFLAERGMLAGFKDGSTAFEFDWPDDRAPPWCLLLEPMGKG